VRWHFAGRQLPVAGFPRKIVNQRQWVQTIAVIHQSD
jgi:hypothetical protein